MKLEVASPLKGEIKQLQEVPDEVFSQKMLGDGLAIDPKENVIHAPFDATVETLPVERHAIGLKSNEGIEVLIHIGVDTVNLKGNGFKIFVKEGNKVTKGQKLIEFDKDFIDKNAPSSIVIVIVINGDAMKVIPTKENQVNAGDFLFNVE
ncbi:MAG: PTS glucose transporter subunit IIA [Elusimicrobiota bacterium]|jgi:glucose-specific phosphotransferase system IIA component|nr:PTS glucose transporter subunit IIA [Elusimicrobiota bacterium]